MVDWPVMPPSQEGKESESRFPGGGDDTRGVDVLSTFTGINFQVCQASLFSSKITT